MATPARTFHRLIYRSRQTAEVAADLDFVVGQIIRSSIRNNREENLTGMLVSFQGVFLQTLEGDADRVRRVYGRILNDGRHCEPAVISAGPAEKRLFAEWNMCARDLSPSDKAIIDVLDARGPFDPARLTPASALRLLTTVADIQRRTALTALIAAEPAARSA
jgi:hypothetical protein